MIRDFKTDNYPNDETDFFVLVGGAHCPKCKKARNALDALWQKGELVGKRVYYVDGHRDRRMIVKLSVSSLPSLVRLRSTKAGIWTVDEATTAISTQKQILAYINSGEASVEDKDN